MILSMTNHGVHNVFPLILNDTPARRALERFVGTIPNREDCYHIGNNGREDDQKKFYVARKSNGIILIEQSYYYDMGLW